MAHVGGIVSRIVKYSILLTLPLTLAACGQPSIDCSSPEVAETLGAAVLQDIDKMMLRATVLGGVKPAPGELEGMLQQFRPKLVGVATTRKDDSINKRFCQAQMTFEFPETVYHQAASGVKYPNLVNFDIQSGAVADLATAAMKSGVQLTSTSVSSPITYSVQTADDGEHFYTEGQPAGELRMTIFRLVGAALAEQHAAAKVHQSIAQSMKQAADRINAEASKAETVDACLDRRIAEFREIEGEEALIRHDVLSEWEEECQAG